MNTFLKFAQEVLRQAKQPLHYREITKRAIRSGLKTKGKTPWATMNARIATDIQNQDQQSEFIRTDPGMYTLNPKVTRVRSFTAKGLIVKHKVTFSLNTKQKGDIAEARVAELITL